MSVFCVIIVICVLAYVFFSKPKTKLGNDKTFLNAEVTWGGEDAKTVCERLTKAKIRAKFKGNHRIN